jgi:hypothetical protein
MLLAVALDEFLEVFAGVVDVAPERGRGFFGIFRAAGFEKFAVGLAG